MCGLGTGELLIILAIVVLLFGASRLPQLGRALGETVKNFKTSSGDKNKEVAATQKTETDKAIEVHEVGQLVDETGTKDGAEEDSKQSG